MSTKLSSTGVTYSDGTTDTTKSQRYLGGTTSSAVSSKVIVSGIPSTARVVTVNIASMQVSSTQSVYLQGGLSDGTITAGTAYNYLCHSIVVASNPTPLGAYNTSKITLMHGGSSTNIHNGILTLSKMTGNTWNVVWQLGIYGASSKVTCGVGQINGTGTLDRLQLSVTSGTFTQGSYVTYYS